jgi:hypothetical protein
MTTAHGCAWRKAAVLSTLRPLSRVESLDVLA